jgi:hypothetical protein
MADLKISQFSSNPKSKVCERYVAVALKFMSSSPKVQKSFSKGSHKSYLQFVEFSASNLHDFQQAADAAFASLLLNETGRSSVLWKGVICAYI